MNDHTTFLFHSPGLLEGMVRPFDFLGAFDRYNESPTGAEADARAHHQDWSAVAEDINAAAQVVAKDLPR